MTRCARGPQSAEVLRYEAITGCYVSLPQSHFHGKLFGYERSLLELPSSLGLLSWGRFCL